MSSMSIKTFLDTAKALLDTENPITVLLRGETGIGKSQLVRQLGAHFNKFVLDRRLSQMTEGDMIGLPSTDGETTRFNPPDWFKRACVEPLILFLDELNRATPEVMQAAFQVVLDRELNGWKLHPKTIVISAINVGSRFTVNEMDPALLRRFWVVDLNPTTEDWLAWARKPKDDFGGSIHDSIIDFIANQDKWLDPAKNAEIASVQPTRHSWERLSDALIRCSVADDPDAPLFYSLTLGFIGTEATIAYHQFAKSIDNRVSGEDILNKYTAKDDKVRGKIKRLGQEKWHICIDKLTEHVLEHCKSLTEKQGKNVAAFMTDLPGELRVAMWSKLTANGTQKIALAKSVWKHCMPLILDVFGVPPGEAGIGVVPNIPSVLSKAANGKDKDKK